MEMSLYFVGINSLILIDVVLITIAMIFPIPTNIALNIQYFDFIVCLILLADWIVNLYLSTPKSSYLKNTGNFLGLIASIPFDLILPTIILPVGFLRYLRLLKLIRIILMAGKLYDSVRVFFDKTNMHKILGGLVLTIVIFTLLLYIFGPSYDWYDDLYFVVVTLTTVGYGDVTPKTHNEKVLALILILIGIFVFSTITASISSFLTDRLIEEDDEDIKSEINENVDNKTKNIMNQLNIVSEENKELKKDIAELKDEINEFKDLIKNE